MSPNQHPTRPLRPLIAILAAIAVAACSAKAPPTVAPTDRHRAAGSGRRPQSPPLLQMIRGWWSAGAGTMDSS